MPASASASACALCACAGRLHSHWLPLLLCPAIDAQARPISRRDSLLLPLPSGIHETSKRERERESQCACDGSETSEVTATAIDAQEQGRGTHIEFGDTFDSTLLGLAHHRIPRTVRVACYCRCGSCCCCCCCYCCDGWSAVQWSKSSGPHLIHRGCGTAPSQVQWHRLLRAEETHHRRIRRTRSTEHTGRSRSESGTSGGSRLATHSVNTNQSKCESASFSLSPFVCLQACCCTDLLASFLRLAHQRVP